MTEITIQQPRESVHQHTVATAVSWRGPARRGQDAVMLHILPSEADSGIWFLRTDIDGDRRAIAARWDSVVTTRSTPVLASRLGVTLHGTTTLLCALRVVGVDNALIEISGPEVPTRPNDFETYLELLTRAGTQRQSLPRKALRVQQPIEVRDAGGLATLTPAQNFRARLIVPRADTDPTAVLWEAAVASDLTEPAGDRPLVESGNEESTIVLRDLMKLPFALRVRLINVIGHLSLAGAPLIGHFTGYRSGPTLHHTLLRALMTRVTASYLTVDQHRMQVDTATPENSPGLGDLPPWPDGKYH